MNHYNVIKKMAPALYGDVLLCKEKSTGEMVAVKRMNIDLAEKNQTTAGHMVLENAQAELYANKKLSRHGGHPNVLQMRKSFEANGMMHLVFDYCRRGELFDLISKSPNGRFDEKTALRYFRQIVKGVKYMHGKGLAHRDLSLENVLIDEQGTCKVCDFGLVSSVSRRTNDSVGKLFYMAPEVYQGREYDPAKVDVWSLGMILFILLTGIPAVEKASLSDERFSIIHREGIAKLIDIWDMHSLISPKVLDLLSRMIHTSPNSRCSIDDILNHSCFGLEQVTPRAGRINIFKQFFTKSGMKMHKTCVENPSKLGAMVA